MSGERGPAARRGSGCGGVGQVGGLEHHPGAAGLELEGGAIGEGELGDRRRGALRPLAADHVPPERARNSPLPTIEASGTRAPLTSTSPVSRYCVNCTITFVCAVLLAAHDDVGRAVGAAAIDAGGRVVAPLDGGAVAHDHGQRAAAGGAGTPNVSLAARNWKSAGGGGSGSLPARGEQRGRRGEQVVRGAVAALAVVGGARQSNPMSCSGARWIRLTNFGGRPSRRTGRASGVTSAGSMGRSDRTGPSESASVEWKTARKRVTPPSTSSSYTTSARSRPACGRAIGAFSIFTVSAGRVARACVVDRQPGERERGATYAVVVVVGRAPRRRGAAFAGSWPPPQAASEQREGDRQRGQT